MCKIAFPHLFVDSTENSPGTSSIHIQKILSNQTERANRILALMEDKEQIDAILESMIGSDDEAIRSLFTKIMDAVRGNANLNMTAQQFADLDEEDWRQSSTAEVRSR